MDIKQTFSLWYVLAALVGMILLQEFVAPRHTQTLTYSQFKQALVAGKLDDVVIADGIATGKLRVEGLEQILPKEKLEVLTRAGGEHGFATVLVNAPGLVAQLDAAKVRYGSVRESKWLGTLTSWVAPALVFFGIWWFLMKRMGGGMSHGMLELGLATYDARPTPLFLNGPTLPEPRTFSERTAETIDGEVRRLLDEARNRVAQKLRTNRETLESLAALLLEKEVVDRTMLDGLMASTAAPAQLRVAAVALPLVDGAS